MGVMRRLSMWRKPKAVSTAVQPFEAEIEEASAPAEKTEEHRERHTFPLKKVDDSVVDLTGDSEEVEERASSLVEQSSAPKQAEPLAQTPQVQSTPLQRDEQNSSWVEQPSTPTQFQSLVQTPQRKSRPRPKELDTMQLTTACSSAACQVSEPHPQQSRQVANVGCEALPSAAVHFDAPLEEVYAETSQAFGETLACSLQSSKWDIRAEALSSLTKLFTDRTQAVASCAGRWRLSCVIMNKFLRDKVMPVQLEAFRLFEAVFKNIDDAISREEVIHAFNTLVEHLLDKLGDSNIRLHEGAKSCILLCAEQQGLLGLGTMVAKLRARLGKAAKPRERAKAHFGILDAVNCLLENFPGRCKDERHDEPCGTSTEEEEDLGSHQSEDFWTEDDVAPFILAGMDDALGARVRASAVALAVTAFQAIGVDALSPALIELRPAKQALLKQRFLEAAGMDFIGDDECEDGSEDLPNVDLSMLVVHGCAVRPPPSRILVPPLPGAVADLDDDEQAFMDGILEEVGAVFNGAGIVNESPTGFLDAHLDMTGFDLDEEDQQLLEQELFLLGMMDATDADDRGQDRLLGLLSDSGCVSVC